jgi:glyoxylase-like metal-dependent hydrolase (beta-lactamase superfamily II)
LYCAAAGWLYNVQEVKPKVFAWISDDVLDLFGDPQFNRAGTAGFIVTSEGVVVVNTTNSPFHGRELLYEIRHHSELPVRYVIDTNSSGEQTLGNEVFTDEQATLISSARTQEQIILYRQLLAARLGHEQDNWKLQDRMRGFHVTPSTETFTTEMALRLGGQEIKLRALLKNGSGDDSVVYLPAAKVLFLGELFQNGYFPHIESRNLRDWADVLRDVEKWDVDVYVPGHGAPGGKKEVAEFRHFLEWFGKEVETRFQEGESLSQVKREIGPLLDNYKWHAPELVSEEVEAIYKQTVRTPANKMGASQPTAQLAWPHPMLNHRESCRGHSKEDGNEIFKAENVLLDSRHVILAWFGGGGPDPFDHRPI